jgi:hypothetical protein
VELLIFNTDQPPLFNFSDPVFFYKSNFFRKKNPPQWKRSALAPQLFRPSLLDAKNGLQENFQWRPSEITVCKYMKYSAKNTKETFENKRATSKEFLPANRAEKFQ